MSQAAMGEETRQRLVAVQRRIAAAAERARRDPSEVQLVVVTKGHPVSRLQALVDGGQRRLGENRVKEALAKIDALGDGRFEIVRHSHRQIRQFALQIGRAHV